jgi:hypothetical protein
MDSRQRVTGRWTGATPMAPSETTSARSPEVICGYGDAPGASTTCGLTRARPNPATVEADWLPALNWGYVGM